jgi:hypothetical protein
VAITEQSLPWAARTANALIASVTYLGRTFWPVDLAIFYPHPWLVTGGVWTSGLVLGAVAAASALAAVTWFVVRARAARPYLLVGWLWYLGTLVQVIGLVQVGPQASADRYSYLPLVGIFMALVLAGADVSPRARRISVVGAAAALGACVFLSARQTARWRDSLTLFSHAVAAVPRNYLAYNHLGLGYHRLGRVADAAAAFDAALAIRADDDWVRNNRAACAIATGDLALAETHLQRALASNPGLADAWNNLGNVRFRQRRYAEAAQHYERATGVTTSDRVDTAAIWASPTRSSAASPTRSRTTPRCKSASRGTCSPPAGPSWSSSRSGASVKPRPDCNGCPPATSIVPKRCTPSAWSPWPRTTSRAPKPRCAKRSRVSLRSAKRIATWPRSCCDAEIPRPPPRTSSVP